MRKWLVTVAAASLAAAACPLPTVAAEYLLGPQDKVRLKVYEWRASRDVIFEWTALNDSFVVGADGTLFLPFVGQIRAQGTAPGDLARAIGDRLMQHMGLGRQPDVAVEIVQYRPFYIVGYVTQPGEFPYRPGLTVLQALGIAGGLRTREEDMSRLEREVIVGQGDVGLLALSNVSLLARKARLESELAGSDDIAFPAQLKDRASNETVAVAMEQERKIFAVRKDAMATQLRALRELKDFLEKELTSLGQQMAFHDQQIELIQKELAGVSALVQKGLAVAPRELSLQGTVAQMQSDRLVAETSLLRVRQEISKTDIEILNLGNSQASEVAAALRETQLQLNEVTSKANTAVQLLHDTEVTAPALLALRERAERAKPIFKIVRTTDSGSQELTAEETTPIEPGDTVKIDIPAPPSGLAALPVEDDVQAGTVSVQGTN
ncbi:MULTISPECIES: polysaccharide biosynthesis/export family protein [Mesorhizobium]|uniref:polysaccharide biosynthesis/export family protein n=6 Tax=Phyllobacteriaceae TaxID=69277 RepID=UPI00046343A8|nr:MULTISPECIES: polysaccharide biosynthesis/export family protein [Mesorhizobium]RUU15914.1 sugar ABC transporter substrate-binding protein [Mesorhizobium sp. Primo-B]RUY27122.1 sugar ABC transporter substrate-binding protein [Mesorhizobium sp. M7A.F.Ca.CA.001.13.2.1]RUZ32587.1 sugar ABC transporter substrate-binding protein [Mesorhizobium sp. M7A.F.Ca.CA.001.15.1.1]RVA03871.1 sugar ABC transporter substrate-binding protein [Mesorhizobium sp. M7A.F.Ca.US.002.01.1.1]RVA67172.1 sugar ABC transp